MLFYIAMSEAYWVNVKYNGDVNDNNDGDDNDDPSDNRYNNKGIRDGKI